MPIYKVPEMSSSLPLHRRSSGNQDERHHHHHHHHHPQQHYVDQHPSQPKHHPQQQQQQQQLDPNENIIQRSHSTPAQTAAAYYSNSPEVVGVDPSEESIVERDIRLQKEREAEIALLHGHCRCRKSAKQADISNHQHGDSAALEGAAHPREKHRETREVLMYATPDVEDGRKAISQYSRVGESLIVKELLEQKQREEELRNHWRNIGMLKTEDVENGMSSAEDFLPRPGSDETTTEAPSANIRSILRGQPFEEDPDDEVYSKQMFITPRTETVIEREIRLLRQREGSFRRARGYPLPSRDDRLREVEIHAPPAVKPGLPGEPKGLPSSLERRTVDGEASDGLSMKRFATNRLKQEMLRERQRELDLRKQGKIYTISEERVGFEPEFSSNQSFLIEDSVSVGGGARLSSGRSESPSNHREPRHLQQLYQNDTVSTYDPSTSELPVVENSRPETLPPWRTSAELRIEEEVKEARRREKELREQRRLVNETLITQLQQQQQLQQQYLSAEQQSRHFYRRT